MKGNSRAGPIAAIVVIVMLVAVAFVGVYAFNGGFHQGGSDGGPSTAPDDTSPWDLPDASTGGSDNQTGAGPSGVSGGSGSSGDSAESNGVGDDGAGSASSNTGPSVPSGPSSGGSDGQFGDGSDVPPSGSGNSGSTGDDGAAPGPGSDGSGSSAPPATTDYIYGAPRVDGFYTGGISVGLGDTPDQGTKASGSDLQTGTNYAIGIDADVTDHGLQWYKDGATLVNSNNDPTNPVKEWMAVDTSIVMVLEIRSDHPISADDVSVSSVYGKQVALGNADVNGPGLRSIEQVDANTVRVVLVSEPFRASSWAGAFQSPISLASSNGSIENFTDKGALAAYAPMKIYFNTPGDYVLSFYLAKLDTSGHVEYQASPTTTVAVSVAAKA